MDGERTYSRAEMTANPYKIMESLIVMMRANEESQRKDDPELIIGIRSLLEHVMIQKVGDQGTFGKNLDEFRKAGFLSQTQADYLAKTLEGGHACTHRSWIPSKEELDTLMDVTESIIETVYVLSDRLAAVKIPPRPKRP